MGAAARMERTRTPGVFRRGGRYVITYRDADGVQHKESAPTYKEACSLRATRLHEVGQGKTLVGRNVTLKELVDAWRTDLAGGTSGIRERTIKDYRSQIDRYILPILGSNTKVTAIRPRNIRGLVKDLRAGATERRPLKPATVRRVLVPLRSALDLAVEEGLISVNPAAVIKVPPEAVTERTERVKALSRIDLKSFLEAVESEHRLFVDAVAATGARWSEAAAWKKKDLDHARRCLRIERSIQQGEIQPPKTENSRREVKLSGSLYSRLVEETKEMDDEAFIFHREEGKPLDYPFCRREILIPAARKSEVEIGGFHTLRHTAASILFESGCNVKEVQHFLGHSNPGFTLNTYIHLIDDSERATIDLEADLDGS